jgi:A/G-specific adenine glycosylase
MNEILRERTEFQASLIRWFQREGRDLPWRTTRDPYRILISEIMLQQTQVATVLGCFERWFQRFPTIESLAAADESEVLHAWQGLGYYHRARNLHRCAKAIVSDHGGIFPKSLHQLSALPGIGRYTAGAIASFAFDRPAAIVDANIARVLSRLLNIEVPIDTASGTTTLWQAAATLLSADQPRLFNSALMELGALRCLPRKPKCPGCPVRRWCAAPDPEMLPRKRTRWKVEQRVESYAWLEKDGMVLLEQQQGQRWKGLWTLPRLGLVPDGAELVTTLSHPITRFLIRLDVYRVEQCESPHANHGFHRFNELQALAIPSPHRRVIAELADLRYDR